MNKKEIMIEKINQILELLNSVLISTENENVFIEKYKSNLKIFKSRIIADEIEVSGIKEHTGLFKWLGEYDNIVKNNPQLYDEVYEMEEIFSRDIKNTDIHF